MRLRSVGFMLGYMLVTRELYDCVLPLLKPCAILTICAVVRTRLSSLSFKLCNCCSRLTGVDDTGPNVRLMSFIKSLCLGVGFIKPDDMGLFL